MKMGMHKHGKNSAKSKSCAKYQAEGRLTKNKRRKALKEAKRQEKLQKLKQKKAGN